MKRNMILVFDTETTGKADFKALPQADHQPHICQLAAVLLDPVDLRVKARFSSLVYPEDYEIPKEAIAIHGITTEMARAYGFPLTVVLTQLFEFTQKAAVRVAHNIEFDDLVVRSAFARIDDEWNTEGTTPFCTMKAMTDICQLPGPCGYKWPKLQEAYKHATGKELTSLHDAMTDVRGCVEIYRWLMRKRPVEGGS